jgi:hypothetical protein
MKARVALPAVVATLFVVLIAPTIALADVSNPFTLPSPCSVASWKSGANLANQINPLNNLLSIFDTLSGNIFDASSKAGLTIATLLGTMEMIWFTVSSLVFKHNMEELFKDLFFKTISITMVYALIVGLAANNGGLAKSIPFTFFPSLASAIFTDIQTNGGLPGQGSAPQITITTGDPTTGIESSSQTIISDAFLATYAIVQCPLEVAKANNAFSVNIFDAGSVVAAILGCFLYVYAVVNAVSVLLLFALLDLALVATMIDGLIVLSAGVFMVGFANSRWTHDNATPYFRLMFSIGWKLFSYIFVANFATILIIGVVNAALKEVDTAAKGNIVGAFTMAPDALMAITLITTFIAALFLNVNSIAKALSSGTLSLGPGLGTVRLAMDAALLLATRGASGAGNNPKPPTNPDSLRNPNQPNKNGNGGGGGGGGGRPPIASDVIAKLGNHAQNSLDGDVTGAGVDFRPHK